MDDAARRQDVGKGPVVAADRPLDPLARIRGRYPRYTRDRLTAFARRLRRLAWPEIAAPALIEAAGPVDRIALREAAALPFRSVALGQELGPLWSTWWFRITVEVPARWAGSRVDLYWNSASEALLWLEGRASRGLNIGRPIAPLIESAAGGERLTFLVEAACNRAFGADEGGPKGGDRGDPYRLLACDIRRFDPEAWSLFHDFDVLAQLEADRTPEQKPMSTGGVAPQIVRPALDTTWAGRLLHELNRVCNSLDPDDKATWPAARQILGGLLATRNADACHALSAIGHAHIDTAWLWPIEETWRKCHRTFATAVALMDAYPRFRFACSQACQHLAIEERDPELFGRIAAKARSGQWLPIGGSWVEPDCNLPSGESICRQFLYGQRYFERTFGARSQIFWNPDVFGYAGQLPQLMRQAGMTRFLTQKLSWNRFTAPPHHSFHWRGIDGSEVLTHFPPADTYNGACRIAELRYHAANYKDADRSEDGLYLFGFGDGGGGPTDEMVERLARVGDLQGVPRAAIRSPDDFFDRLERSAADLETVEGELYFEYHRGTYTSQAEVKRLNRLVEGRLQTLEWLCAVSARTGLERPQRDEIEALWRALLTNQFHDILPGSSISEVYARTVPELESLAERCAVAAGDLLKRLAGEGEGDVYPVNPAPFARAEVAQAPDGTLRYISAPAMAAGTIVECPDEARAREKGGRFVLENAALSAVISAQGDLVSLVHKASGREVLAGSGGRLLSFDDRPTAHEAWDIDPFALETARAAPAATEVAIVRPGPLRAEVRIVRPLGAASRLEQRVILDAASPHLEFDCALDWRDRRTFIKAVFETSIRAPRASFETMFGAVERPTHASTDADLARFEVPAHRWADLAEPDFGLSLITDCRYGYSAWGGVLGLSLIRGPMIPDPGADIGEHRFRYALYPHQRDWRSAATVARAAAFNRALLWASGAVPETLRAPLASASSPHVVIDTVKPAEDGQGLVFRLYEASGGSARTRIVFSYRPRQVFVSNTLEDRLEELEIFEGAVELQLRGFQIVTLRAY
ncbi:MAG TPA: glycoside hydrolase family 38 C-terminal domain-containing protein [Caulobacteraceae bacterium]|nr:glycoside hydrolase family 38 C-terminal domain-containing protein [Caulobacteraceae bacterium]